MSTTTYHTIALPNSVTVSYALAGESSLPPLLLLHGFPSSSHQFRNLIPLLSSTWHVIAPDLPGFGNTTVPGDYVHTFNNMAETIGLFLDAIKQSKVTVYIFDYGAPTAFRLALKRPDVFNGIITQNGNAYEEGLGAAFWEPLQTWWKGDEKRAPIADTIQSQALTLESTKWQYEHGTPEGLLPRIDPAAYLFDYWVNLSTAEQKDVQMSLFWDYRTNVGLYPDFQRYLRESGIPVLVVWGKGDACFLPAGAKAYEKDVKNVRVVLLDGGHFLLETHVDEVAAKINGFASAVAKA
ncbi:Alpha/Beta hydrolase protein [Papiliotrema laurentii]|uniref:Alpha/Beta hydrolase protein n=1 Tax=Papiliotrema laurentii TaxID=5418 RepID=A0AAD9CX65_PAPLA|nr:Alpha/Beta hydrolase protein [Papiliotrema laurentii]